MRHFTTERGCSCPDWLYRPRKRPCKHVRRLVEARELIEAQQLHNELVKRFGQPSDLNRGER